MTDPLMYAIFVDPHNYHQQIYPSFVRIYLYHLHTYGSVMGNRVVVESSIIINQRGGLNTAHVAQVNHLRSRRILHTATAGNSSYKYSQDPQLMEWYNPN